MTAFVANTNNLHLIGLKSASDGDFINDATVTVTIKDSAGATVSGQSWPVSMNYVSASDGDYLGVIPHTTQLLSGRNYTAEIEVNAGVNRIGFWAYEFKAASRRD